MTFTSSSRTTGCPCGCGATVRFHSEGFAATTVTVEACPTLAERGWRSYEMRKSAFAGAPAGDGGSFLQHPAAL